MSDYTRRFIEFRKVKMLRKITWTRIFLAAALLVAFGAILKWREPLGVDQSKHKQMRGEIVYPHLRHTKNELESKSTLQELVLKNGMRVYLAKAGKKEEVCLKVIAKGGFESLSANDKRLCELMVKSAIESGVAEKPSGQLSSDLYKMDAEFSIGVTNFSRGIEASFYAQNIDYFADLVCSIFTRPSLTFDGYLAAVDLLNSKNRESGLHSQTSFEANFEDFQRCRKLYREAFNDPGEFVFVLTGDIELEKTKKFLISKLENISKKGISKKSQTSFTLKEEPRDYLNLKVKEKDAGKIAPKNENLIIVTIPLKSPVDANNFPLLEILCRTAEKKLKKQLPIEHIAEEVNVTYEFPFYPLQENPQVVISYRFLSPQSERRLELLKNELLKISENGFDEALINRAKRSFYKEFLVLEKDPYALSSVLSDYAFWGWRPEDAFFHAEKAISVRPEELNSFMKDYFDPSGVIYW